jgi:hypothetical protein
MDTLRIGAIRYKNIDWLCLGKTPGAAGVDGRRKGIKKVAVLRYCQTLHPLSIMVVNCCGFTRLPASGCPCLNLWQPEGEFQALVRTLNRPVTLAA